MVEWLGDVIHRAQLHGVDGRAQAGVAGHDEYRNVTGQLNQVGAGATGQTQVTDDHVKVTEVELSCSVNGVGLSHLVLVTLQQPFNGVADNGLVFDD